MILNFKMQGEKKEFFAVGSLTALERLCTGPKNPLKCQDFKGYRTCWENLVDTQ